LPSHCDSFLRWIWKITGGNAEVLENTGVDKKAIRKLMKTKGRIYHEHTEALKTECRESMAMRSRKVLGPTCFWLTPSAAKAAVLPGRAAAVSFSGRGLAAGEARERQVPQKTGQRLLNHRGGPERDIEIRVSLRAKCCQIEYIHIRLTFERGGRI